jgi:ferrochelatase
MAESRNNRIGVLLFNLGGPEKLEDVKPFLFNLFSDPDIIRLPWRALQKPLAWLIATQRQKKSRGYYSQIGGGSPLRRITDEQAKALQAALVHRGFDARVYVGMRYWNPFIEEALDEISRDGITQLVVLPLYPQYSLATTAGSLNRMNEILAENGRSIPGIKLIKQWHDDPTYIAALTRTVSDELAQFPIQDPSLTHIVLALTAYRSTTLRRATLRSRQRDWPDWSSGWERSAAAPLFQSKVGPVNG